MGQKNNYGGKWVRGNRLGEGGQAPTYEAKAIDDSDSSFKYAIKVLQKTKGMTARKRFYIESESLKILDHPNIAQLIDCNTSEYSDLETELYIVIELIKGTKLSKTPIPLPPNTAAAITIKILEALQYAHEQDVVHRDIKPDNILFRDDSLKEPVLVDFGLSTNSDLSAISLPVTENDEMVGNRFMMCPESVYGCADRYSASMDLMQASGVFFYLLTGIKPNAWRDIDQLAPHERTEAMQYISQFDDHVSDYVNDFFMKAFMESPLHRWGSASEMIEYLDPLAKEKYEDLLRSKLKSRLSVLVASMAMHSHFNMVEVLTKWGDLLTGVLQEVSKSFPKSDARYSLNYGSVEQMDSMIRIQSTVHIQSGNHLFRKPIFEVKANKLSCQLEVKIGMGPPVFVLLSKPMGLVPLKSELEVAIFDVLEFVIKSLLDGNQQKLDLRSKYKEVPQPGLFGGTVSIFEK